MTLNPYHFNYPPFHWDDPMAHAIHDVRLYGAKGDGSTDDSAAIQAAIDAAEANGGGTVYVPSGTYMISSSLTIEADDIELHLDINATIKATEGFSGTEDFMIYVGAYEGAASALSNVVISGYGTIDGGAPIKNISAIVSGGGNIATITIDSLEYSSGDQLVILNSDSTPTIDGSYDSTSVVKVSATEVDIDVGAAITVAGTTGTIGKTVRAINIQGATQNCGIRDVTVKNCVGTKSVQIGGAFVADAGAVNVDDTAQAGTTTTITLAAGSSSTDDDYNGDRIILTTGDGFGDYRFITDYNGTTKVATVTPEWIDVPGASTTYKIHRCSRGAFVNGIKIIDCYEGLLALQCHQLIISNCYVKNMIWQDGIEPSYTTASMINNNTVEDIGPGNSYIDCFDTAVDVLISQNTCYQSDQSVSTSPTKGLTLSATGNEVHKNVVISQNTISGGISNGMVITPGASGKQKGVLIINNNIDIKGEAPRGIILDSNSGVEIIENNNIQAARAISATNIDGRGISVDDQTATPCMIKGNYFRNGQTDIRITDNPTVSGTWEIIGNRFTPHDSGRTLYPIRLDVASIPVYMADNTVVSAYLTRTIDIQAGTGSIAFGYGNRGELITDNSGLTSGTIADGGTIAHGLSTTPDYVQVSGYANTAGDIVSVASVDGTNITVNVKTGAGAAGTATRIAWQARVLVDNGNI